MADEHTIARYRNLYAQLLRFYPKPYRERFAEGMEQTFNDLCREREQAGDGLFGFVLWMFAETSAGIIRENLTFLMMQHSMMRIAIGTGVMLLIPLFLWLLAIWHWRPGALVCAIVLLVGAAGLTYELVAKKKMSNKAYRFAVGVAVATVFVLVWMNAAVGGILGDDPANMMYFGVLLVGLIGALIARLEPQGMSRALFATALAMVLVPAIALVIGTPAFANGVPAVFGLHAVYAMLFVASALLFRRAAREQQKPDLNPTA
jgi:MFS family permease